MSKEEIGEERERTVVAAGQLGARKAVIHPVNSEGLSRFEDLDEQLFPRLSNELVLDQIVPKLPWRAFHILSSVSRCWRQAIRSRQVYETRVRSHSTETVIVINYFKFNCTGTSRLHGICLYSVREKTWHQLPLFPNGRSGRGIHESCRFLASNGKIYLLGGEAEEDRNIDSREVYVLDVAGQTGWKQCAKMLEPRQDFACGVIDGKIYVVGGSSSGKSIRSSEVYDPKENAWSSTMPMKSTRSDHHFVTVGEELMLYGGQFYDPDYGLFGEGADDYNPYSDGLNDALFAEVYHAGKDEWELVKPFEVWSGERLFTAHGKMHSMTRHGIWVNDFYDDDEDPWRQLHSLSFSGVEAADSVSFDLFAAQAVNDELLALVNWPTGKRWPYNSEMCLLQSKGFGSENDGIVLEKLHCPLSCDDISTGFGGLGSPGGLHFMCPIEL